MAVQEPSHLVLARKWRPERFSELVGQEHVTRTLGQALASGRIAHAFLFTGIRGVGKTTAARILARCLNCERGPTAEPCGECAACTEIKAGRALDVVEIDGATYRKIDDARAIIENLSYRPARDRFKIYIIDEAHQLTDQAFNALLKTLEEPPPHVKFILATTEPQKMPETILSRLQRYDFRRIPFGAILARLNELARREGVSAEPGAIALIAREAGGSMRDAERMLEMAIAMSPGKVAEAEVASTLGVASRAKVFAIADAILRKDAAAALGAVRELHGRGANLEALGRDLLETIRNLAVAKLPASSADLLADLPDQESAEIKRLAEMASARDLMRLFRLMANAQEEVIKSPYPDLLLEMAVVRMASLAPVVEADELLRAIGAEANSPAAAVSGTRRDPRGGTGDGSGGGTRRLRVDGEVKAEAPRRAESAQTSPPSAAAAPDDMPELRLHIKSRKAPLAGFMEQSTTLELDGAVLRVRVSKEIYLRYLGDNKNLLAEIASEFYGRRIAVEFADNGSAPRASSSPAQAPSAGSSDPSPREHASASNGSEVTPAMAAFEAARRTASATAANGENDRNDREEARKALLADPVMRRVFDEFGGRLVDIRLKPRLREDGGK
jgi:DNA polymerase-3 subunit gamma/tau